MLREAIFQGIERPIYLAVIPFFPLEVMIILVTYFREPQVERDMWPGLIRESVKNSPVSEFSFRRISQRSLALSQSSAMSQLAMLTKRLVRPLLFFLDLLLEKEAMSNRWHLGQ